MKNLTDDQLIDELKKRFWDKRKYFEDLEKLTEKLIKVNQKLTQSEMMKSHFLSNIRNEINNPLTSILGLSENIKTQPNMDKKMVQQMAKLIHKEAFYLDFQLRTIFAAAELEAGEAQPYISNVDITELIYRVINMYEETAKDKNVAINFTNKLISEKGEDFVFKTDAEKIHLVLSHVIDNGIEYGHEGKKINICAGLLGDKLKIDIKDFGIGIKDEDLGTIFDRFLQLNSGTTKEYKGQGLGLSVVKGFIELLAGEITVKSEKGKNTVFTIILPEQEMPEEMSDISFDGNEELF